MPFIIPKYSKSVIVAYSTTSMGTSCLPMVSAMLVVSLGLMDLLNKGNKLIQKSFRFEVLNQRISTYIMVVLN